MIRVVRLQSLIPMLTLACVLFAPTVASAVVALNYTEADVTITRTTNEVVYSVDLGTLPDRAGILVDIVPDDPTVALEIGIGNWSGVDCPGLPEGTGGFLDASSAEWTSTATTGPSSLLRTLLDCSPNTQGAWWQNETVDVAIRVRGWGPSAVTVDVDLSIRGVTLPPTNEHFADVDENPLPQYISRWPSKDTVLYESDKATSNGAGTSLWAGYDYQIVGSPIGVIRWFGLRSLMAFDILDQIPLDSNVTHAELELYAIQLVSSGAGTWLYEVADGAGGETWHEGNANSPGSEFTGGIATNSAADWNDRQGTLVPWATPGGDIFGGLLDYELVDSIGYVTYASNALNDTVQNMVDSRVDENGFLLVGPAGGVTSIEFAARFASSEYAINGQRPTLHVWFEPPAGVAGDSFWNGTASYLSEGQNFRWIYDTNDDDLLTTSIGGVCERVGSSGTTVELYNYSYTGGPYTGTDCCAFKIDSLQSGVTGTGQAIFFHNLDASNPLNHPPDTDGDGMRDGCDNCANVPNGPYLGSCIGLAGVGASCLSDLECGQYEYCSLSQEDVDLDQTGDACSVPEPGFVAGLMIGLAALTGLDGRRRLG